MQEQLCQQLSVFGDLSVIENTEERGVVFVSGSRDGGHEVAPVFGQFDDGQATVLRMPSTDDKIFFFEPVDQARNSPLIERERIRQFTDRVSLAVEKQGHDGPLRYRQPMHRKASFQPGFHHSAQAVMPITELIRESADGSILKHG